MSAARKRRADDETTMTIQVAGQEPVTATMGAMQEALGQLELNRLVAHGLTAVKGARARKASMEDPKQGDIEAVTGVADKQKEHEAEVGGIAVDRLRSIIERVERLEEERKAIAGDIKDIFAEAKSAGFEVKVIKLIIAIRKKDAAEVEEQETLLDLYRRALGM